MHVGVDVARDHQTPASLEDAPPAPARLEVPGVHVGRRSDVRDDTIVDQQRVALEDAPLRVQGERAVGVPDQEHRSYRT